MPEIIQEHVKENHPHQDRVDYTHNIFAGSEINTGAKDSVKDRPKQMRDTFLPIENASLVLSRGRVNDKREEYG